jgi:hypothetical protein
MGERTVVAIADGPVTRLGQLVLAGEAIDDEPIMPSTLRVLDAYVLSVLIDGEGNYRDADGCDERIRPGAHTIVPRVSRIRTAPTRRSGGPNYSSCSPGRCLSRSPTWPVPAALPGPAAVDRGAAHGTAFTAEDAQSRRASVAGARRLADRHR